MSLRWGDPKYPLDMPVSPRGLLRSGRDSEAGLMTVLNTGRTLQCRQRPGRGLGVFVSCWPEQGRWREGAAAGLP